MSGRGNLSFTLLVYCAFILRRTNKMYTKVDEENFQKGTCKFSKRLSPSGGSFNHE